MIFSVVGMLLGNLTPGEQEVSDDFYLAIVRNAETKTDFGFRTQAPTLC